MSDHVFSGSRVRSQAALRARRAGLLAACGLAFSVAAFPSVGLAQESAFLGTNPVTLQWFDSSFYVIEHRMPDVFRAGYGGIWLPPVGKASTGSVGYDAFDRFDLGSPASPTMYGTESFFRAVVGELKQGNVNVYVDVVLNHNGARSSNAQFIADGSWPGFYLPGSGLDFWGDFHDGTTQSTNPNDPNYNLFTGDLVSLIDIAQEKNYQFIRQPVAANAQNIPPGNVRNRPDPNNARFYPDRNLAPKATFVNTAPGDGTSWTIYPFNNTTPLAGDVVVENATGLLVRSCQWMLDEFKVDGFRIDAMKHTPSWFFTNFFDPSVYQRRTAQDGSIVTPYSFGESVDSNNFIINNNYSRRDAIGNRDALDLNEAGALRDVRSQLGFGSWANVLNATIDFTDNGIQDGTLGVHHVYSHDNGSTGNGSSAPSLPGPSLYAMPQNAYILFRPGMPIIYFNGREMQSRFSSRGFWPREGNPTALGDLDTNLTRLVQLHNGYVRGNYYPLNGTDPSNTSNADVLIYERSNGTRSNVLVAVNDRYDNGTQTRNVATTFPPGTRLRELSGTASDPVVDPGDAIRDVLLVGNDGRLRDPATGINGPITGIVVPNNTNINGVQHHRGYVVYAPAGPSGTLQVLNIDGGGVRTVPASIAADDNTVPSWRRRNTAVPVVTTGTFEIRLDTTKTDPADTNWDDYAVFRIDRGFVDLNGNGVVDKRANNGSTVDRGYEEFLTQFSPIDGPSGNGTAGVYRQVINTSLLTEGYHYLSVISYRRRIDGGLPIFTEFRLPFYVDRTGPAVTLNTSPIGNGSTIEWRVTAADRTADRVYVMLNVPVGTNPLTLVGPATQAYQYDRFEWRRNLGNVPAGSNSISVVAYEDSGNVSVQTITGVTVALGSGDVNQDGFVTIDDLYAQALIPENTPQGNAAYRAEADLNADNNINALDRTILADNVIRLRQRVSPFRGLEAQDMRSSQR